MVKPTIVDSSVHCSKMSPASSWEAVVRKAEREMPAARNLKVLTSSIKLYLALIGILSKTASRKHPICASVELRAGR